jgi:hypothetical protein
MATKRFRRNNIDVLKNKDGMEISDHQQMAGLLSSSYKERMGCSYGIYMQFDLSTPLDKVEGLDEPTIPFE